MSGFLAIEASMAYIPSVGVLDTCGQFLANWAKPKQVAKLEDLPDGPWKKIFRRTA